MADGRVYIHAGAHRTGTSSFQNCLALNRAALERAGFDLAYPGRDGAPGGTLALRLPHPRHRKTPDGGWIDGARAELARHQGAAGRALVLSEENIPGRMFHFYQGQFYPAARRRAAILRAALPGPVAHLLFVIRPYADLFTSAYRKRAEDNQVVPFTEIAPRMAAIPRGWPEILGILQAQLQPERMTVVDYAARGESRDLLAHLLPDAAPSLQEPPRDLNVSATDSALEALQDRYRAGEELARPDWQAVIADHAGQTDDRGFARFTDAQRDRLDERWRRDRDAAAAMPGIKFVG